MENHIIIKEDGTRLPWNTNKLNKHFCLLYHDNNKKYIFTPQTNLKCQLFMIGGGGAGGYYFGGGGGAGAAYINNNFTFEQGKTYTFSIGTGGTCDISNFNKLFNSGLSLNVYNNTSPNFNNLSFNYDDYSSLGIDSSGIMQSFIVDNITINPTIYNTNTTYIWNGYIKSTSTDNNSVITIRLNSKIYTIIWINTYQFTYDNAFIKTNGDKEEVKVFQLDPNKFYNIKIIAYNFDTSNPNFNVNFDNCKFYNFNKNNEKYNVVPATDTIMTFKTISSNENNVISCKGGGTGGYGLYNNNTNLNGGCGGGSGINKIKGISTNNNPIYNGNDGAVGNYCGGGGGIISPGTNNIGGEGKILQWFNETLLFGAGGNGANNNENRNLGYGCGGNGGDCCYFSKSLINNNGNNGCIIIYINNTTEGFTDLSGNSADDIELVDTSSTSKTNHYLRDNNTALVSRLINDSYLITLDPNNSFNVSAAGDRSTYFNTLLTQSFLKLAVERTAVASTPTDNNNMHNFIYDILVITKIYAVTYRLLYNHYKITLGSNIIAFANFIKFAKIKFKNGNTGSDKSEINNNIIYLNNIFNITNLKINSTSSSEVKYNDTDGIYIGNTIGSPNIDKTVFDASKQDIIKDNNLSVPFYHNHSNNQYNNIDGLVLFYTNTDTLSNINKISNTYIQTNSGGYPNTYETINNSTTDVIFRFYDSLTDDSTNGFLTRNSLTNLYTTYTNNITSDNTRLELYEYTRILLYMETFNTILNTNAYTSLLPTLKYQMFAYNSILYNVIIQYNIFMYQKDRLIYDSGSFTVPSAATTPTLSTLTDVYTKIDNTINKCGSNLNNITSNINSPNDVTDTLKIIVNMQKDKDITDTDYNKYQKDLNESINKYNDEFKNYNLILYYYKIIIIAALFLILLIFFIFTLNTIDNNAKIGIYIFIILFIIILLVYYNNNIKVSENFVIYNDKNNSSSSCYAKTSGDNTIDYSSYKTALNSYNTAILKFISNATIDKNLLTPTYMFNKNINTIRKNKAEYYKLKKINIENAIELLHKSSNSYYYFMIFIIMSIIILLFSLILLLINQNMLIQIIGIAAVFIIILIYYITYKINKPTRLAESKNYWANFNPSSETLKSL